MLSSLSWVLLMYNFMLPIYILRRCLSNWHIFQLSDNAVAVFASARVQNPSMPGPVTSNIGIAELLNYPVLFLIRLLVVMIFSYIITSVLCTFLEYHEHWTGVKVHSLSKCSTHWLRSSSLVQPYGWLGHGIFWNLQEALYSYICNFKWYYRVYMFFMLCCMHCQTPSFSRF